LLIRIKKKFVRRRIFFTSFVTYVINRNITNFNVAMTTSTNNWKKQKSIDIIHVLTIRKHVKKNFHLWTSIIFMISTNNKWMFALIDNDFNQNFIDQRLAYKWRLRLNENLSTNSQIMNDTFLRVFRSHFLKFSSKKDDEKIFKIK
jgi:hypothetical protein